ncbi:MAG: ion channel [Acidobacteriota bacterium]
MAKALNPPAWIERLVRFLRRENLHRILLSLLALIVLGALALSFLEPGTTLADWLWWGVVTVTTVGYGDIAPSSVGGRLIGVVLMFCGIGVVSLFTATIAGYFVEIKLKRERGMEALELKNHIILCGWNQRAEAIYRELRSDARSADEPIVLLAPIDAKPVDDGGLHFIRGDVTEENLARANIETASTVVILGDDDLEPGARDAKVVLSTLTVEALNPDTHTVVELVKEENARHCRRARADEIIVGNQFSSRLIASAAIDHGISSVMSELLSATYGNDLRSVPVPPDLAGRSFLEVFTEMKRSNSSIVLAVQKDRTVDTNPDQEVRVEAADHLIIIAPSAQGA